MRTIFSLLISFFSFGILVSQPYTIRLVSDLPVLINESSGLEFSTNNKIWTHNDNGDPELFCIDTSGNILRKITITNALNIDWEDITKDYSGNLYIGDFGNNDNNRENLVIYKIPNPDLHDQNFIEAGIIEFSLSDQSQFPPSTQNLNFDIEAIVWREYSLYLFTKNRSEPSSGYTKLYKLPSTSGNYNAQLLDSIFTDTEISTGRITAADINNNTNQLVLLSKCRIYYFDNFIDDNFFSENIQTFTLPVNTGKEGICFINSNELFISDEKENSIGGKLYRINISNSIDISKIPHNENKLFKISIYPNPCEFYINISCNKTLKNSTIKICNSLGYNVVTKEINNTTKSYKINISKFQSGLFVLKLIANDIVYQETFIKTN